MVLPAHSTGYHHNVHGIVQIVHCTWDHPGLNNVSSIVTSGRSLVDWAIADLWTGFAQCMHMHNNAVLVMCLAVKMPKIRSNLRWPVPNLVLFWTTIFNIAQVTSTLFLL